ncbi:MAG: T9SS type A sorting domain-containing protein [Flavobacteriia bacterium]|nr:T9SS type A sorting domain-containing protein [Flavobacteriia bacterium]
MKNFTPRGSLASILTAVVLSLFSTSSFAQGGCANAVSNVVFFNQTATTVDVTFTNPISSNVTVEWGPSCFMAGTGPTTTSSNDTATLFGLDSSQCYNVYFFNSGCLTTVSYCSPCPTSGNHATNPLHVNLSPIANGVNFYEYIKTGTENCYTDAHSFTPDIDVVWEYMPSLGATEINISTCSSHDTTRLFLLDSNQQLISTNNSTCGVGSPSPWNTIFKSEKIDNFQVNPNMRYYIVVEIEQNDTCGSGIYFSIEETVSTTPITCAAPYNLDSTVAGCDAVALTWMDSTGNSSYLVEYGPAGFTPGSGSLSTVTDTFSVLSNLNFGSMYDVYVSTICASDTSSATGPLTVSTVNTSGQVASMNYTVTFLGIFNGMAEYQFDGTSSTADSIIWNFGDGSAWEVGWTPNHSYSANGVYIVTAIAVLGCSVDSVQSMVTVVPWSVDEALANSVSLYPNPTSSICKIEWEGTLKVHELNILDTEGRVVQSEYVDGNFADVDLTQTAKGIYIVQLVTTEGVVQKRLIVL